MEPTLQLWGAGVLLGALTVFVWFRLVRLALTGRWPVVGPLMSSAAEPLKDNKVE